MNKKHKCPFHRVGVWQRKEEQVHLFIFIFILLLMMFILAWPLLGPWIKRITRAGSSFLSLFDKVLVPVCSLLVRSRIRHQSRVPLVQVCKKKKEQHAAILDEWVLFMLSGPTTYKQTFSTQLEKACRNLSSSSRKERTQSCSIERKG